MGNKKPNIQRVIRRLMSHIRQQEKHISPMDIDNQWRAIEQRILAERRKKTRYRIFYTSATSAAAVILICMFWLGKQFISHYSVDSLITDYALQAQVDSSSEGEILLLMSGNREIEIKETDANIIYSQNGIVTVNVDTVNRVTKKGKEIELNQLIIPKGKRTRLTLSDGTHLWVNSCTRVVYPNCFEKDRREIYVEGEVYLDVFRNEKAPFVVKTKDFQVQVLGTSFNISAYPSESISSVVLVEGSVNVKNQKKKQVKLVPGQLVNIHTGQLDAPKNVDVEPYVCWVKNMLMYTNEPLDKVLKKISLYYGREFLLEPDIAMLQVSGKLDLKEKLEDVLQTISFSAPICCEMSDGKIVVKRKR